MSEQHALGAIASGAMNLTAPDGQPIRLQFKRVVEHRDGNWTWIGRDAKGQEAIITFGEKAVFGTIPNGRQEPLELATAAGRTWLVDADERALAAAGRRAGDSAIPDFLPAPSSMAARVAGKPVAAAAPRSGGVRVAEAGTGSATIDIVLGYTSGFATRLGGESQAVTRLNFMVDVANQAYANSQVSGSLRLAQAVQVDYPDATSNRTALFELSGVACSNVAGLGDRQLPETGVSCTSAPVPAALQPLLDARARYGADLVSLVRNLSYPENGSCGVAWLLGAGQTEITAAQASFGISVVSDSNGNAFPDDNNTCRNETLAHETGHNLGLQHDVEVAQGSNGTLDAEEYGRFQSSFGYVDSTNGFYTIMANRRTGLQGYRVFSNPRITFCGGFLCGAEGQADSAGTLQLTMPIVAAFNAPTTNAGVWIRADFNGDGKADILWRNTATGQNVIWRSAQKGTSQAVETVDTDWFVAGVGDFNGDARADILWRNAVTGANVLWPSAQRAGRSNLATVDTGWAVAAVADFNGDGKDDLLWRNGTSGANSIWQSADRTRRQTVASVVDTNWTVAAAADFNGDGRADILWRDGTTGGNVKWPSANAGFKQTLPTVGAEWSVAASADFNGDGSADVLWRNGLTGANTIWRSANRNTRQTVASVTDTSWGVAAAGDFNGDGRGDLLWRNGGTGANTLWFSANNATKQALPAVTDLSWIIAG